MGGWKHVSGGIYSKGKCKCGQGEVIISVSDHEESDFPPFFRGEKYSGKTTCTNNCMHIDQLSQAELEKCNPIKI